MQIARSGGTSGSWLKKEDLRPGEELKIVSEAQLVEGQHGTQLVAKVQVRGSKEPVNTSINKTSTNALIDAFGSDTKDWINQIVTAVVESAIVAGKRQKILYLVPPGYELTDGDDGFMTIIKNDLDEVQPVSRSRAKKEDEPEEEIEVPW